MKTAILAVVLVGCLDTREGARAGADAEARADADAGEREEEWVVSIAVGTGVCERWSSGRVLCQGVEVAKESEAIAAAGTEIWHEELLGCALVDDTVECASALERYTIPLAGHPVMLALGDHAGAVALDSGDVYTWDPLTFPDPAPPTLALAPVRSPRALTCGFSFCCAVDQANDVVCFGDSHMPTPPTFDQDVLQVGAGLYHACALLADRSVQCWSSQDQTVEPVVDEPVLRIEAGGWTTCAETATRIVCVSSGEQYELAFDAEVEQLDVGYGVCALLVDGRIVCP